MIILNKKQLQNAFIFFSDAVESGKELFLIYEFNFKDKTKKQLALVFGEIVPSVRMALQDADKIKRSIKETKVILYHDFSEWRAIIGFNGRPIPYNLTMSDMDREQMIQFIDRCIQMCNERDILLNPYVHHLWINNIDKMMLKNLTIEGLRYNDEVYLQHQRNFGTCLACAKYLPTEPSHIRFGSHAGTGQKPPDYLTLPLCHDCHMELHQKGEGTFYQENLNWILKKMTIQEFAIISYKRFYNGGKYDK